MHKILKDRIMLIRSLYKGLDLLQEEDIFKTKSDIFKSDFIKEGHFIINTIREDKEQHFLSLSQDEGFKVSYSKSIDTKYNNDKRIKTTLGRYISRNIKYNVEKFPQNLSSNFVTNVWGSLYTSFSNFDDFKILTGDAIVDKYRELNGQSCMTGDAAIYTVLYAINPNVVSLVTYKSFRALLWKTQQGDIILDKVYPSNFQALCVLQCWAKTKGYKYCGDILADYSVKLTVKEDMLYPYLDTFRYGYFSRNKLLLSTKELDETTFVFDSTEGDFRMIAV